MILLPLAFHAPLIYAAIVLARACSDSHTARWRDAFLIGVALLQVEWLALGTLGIWQPSVVLTAHGVIALVAFRWSRRSRPTPPNPISNTPERPALAATMGAVAALLGAAAIARTLGLPDPFDSLTYHLMIPARSFETGTVPLVATYFGDLAPTYTPAAIEGFFAALFLPFGSDAAARIGQLPFALLAVLSVARITRLGGGGPVSITAAVASFLFLPELFIQATDSMVDVAAAALFLAAVDQLLHLDASTKHRRWWILGITIGLFVGSRFTSLVFLPGLALLALLPPSPIRSRWRGWVIAGVGTVLLGGYPYLRNLLETGNPIYPLATSLFGVDLPGLFTSSATAASAYHLTSAEQAWTVLLDRFRIFGLAWLALGLALPWRPGGDAIARRLAGVALVCGLLHFTMIPYDANLRFLFGAWGCAVAAATISLAGLRRGIPVLGWLGLSSLILGAVGVGDLTARKLVPGSLGFDVARIVPLALGAIACIGAAIGWTIGGARMEATVAGRTRARVVLGTALVLVVGGLEVAIHYRRDHAGRVHARDVRLVGVAEILWDAHAPGPPRTIAYAGLNTPYLLRGSRGQHRVVYVPLDGSAIDSLPHELVRTNDPPSPTPNFRPDETRASFERWLETIRSAEVDDLVVFGSRTLEHEWAKRADFGVVTTTPSGAVWYRVRR